MLIGIRAQVKQHVRTRRQMAPLLSEINDEATFFGCRCARDVGSDAKQGRARNPVFQGVRTSADLIYPTRWKEQIPRGDHGHTRDRRQHDVYPYCGCFVCDRIEVAAAKLP